jgi:hypothetical protein
MTPTEIKLIAVHRGPTVSLEDVSRKYLGMDIDWAQKQAKRNLLPFPTFRLNESSKATLMVATIDLANYIDKQRADAAKSWGNSQV